MLFMLPKKPSAGSARVSRGCWVRWPSARHCCQEGLGQDLCSPPACTHHQWVFHQEKKLLHNILLPRLTEEEQCKACCGDCFSPSFILGRFHWCYQMTLLEWCLKNKNWCNPWHCWKWVDHMQSIAEKWELSHCSVLKTGSFHLAFLQTFVTEKELG